jgi:hypothetical protein
MRISPFLVALAAAASLDAHAQLAIETTEGGVPAYLPRGAFLGAYLNQGAVVPQGRLLWQVTLVQARNDALVGVFEGGGGFAVTHPVGFSVDAGRAFKMTSMYQHTVLIGLGYRATYANNFHWGFQVLSGPVFYGATYDSLPAERRWDGNVEGRVEFGLKVGEVTFGVSGGWAQPYNTLINSVAVQYVGGPMFGAFLDWRPLPKR